VRFFQKYAVSLSAKQEQDSFTFICYSRCYLPLLSMDTLSAPLTVQGVAGA